MKITAGSWTIKNCTITSNALKNSSSGQTLVAGAGIYFNGSSITISEFSGNTIQSNSITTTNSANGYGGSSAAVD